jgi:hypothetical protein
MAQPPGSWCAQMLWLGQLSCDLTASACCAAAACRDQQGATAYDMCIGDAARGLLEEKEAGLTAGARSRPVRYVCWLLLSCGSLEALVHCTACLGGDMS